MRRIRLAPDFCAAPLWDVDDGGMLELSVLPIDGGLAARLQAWADRFDATLDPDDPKRSGFASREDEVSFDAEGRALARDLRRRLGPDYVVEYAGETQDPLDA